MRNMFIHKWEMPFTSWFLFLPLCLLSFYSFEPANKNSYSEKWVSLFNGHDIRNWTPKIAGYTGGENYGNTFRVENGILKVRYDQYDSFRNRFGALYYNKKFTNYRLKVEYGVVGDTIKDAPS